MDGQERGTACAGIAGTIRQNGVERDRAMEQSVTGNIAKNTEINALRGLADSSIGGFGPKRCRGRLEREFRMIRFDPAEDRMRAEGARDHARLPKRFTAGSASSAPDLRDREGECSGS